MYNQKSTPKKMQNCSDEIDKRVSIDVIYSELQDLKNNMNKSYDYANKLNQIEKTLKIKDDTIKSLELKVNEMEEMQKNLLSHANQEFSKLKQEIDFHVNSNRRINGDFSFLSEKFDKLNSEVVALKQLKVDNNIENIIKHHMDNSFLKIKSSMEENMNKINDIFTKSLSLNTIPVLESSVNPINSKTVSINESVISCQQTNVSQDTNNKSSSSVADTSKDSKLQIGYFGMTVNNLNKNVSMSDMNKPSSPFKENDGIKLNSSQENALLIGNKLNTSQETPTLFGIKSNPIQENSILFGNKSNTSQETATLFGNKLNTSQETATLFGNKSNISQETVTLFGNKSNIPQETASLFGNKSNIPQETATLFGNKSHIPQETATLFGNKSNIPQETSTLFGNKSNIPQETSTLFGNKSNIPQETATLFGNKSNISQETTTLFGNKSNPSILFGGDNKSSNILLGESKSDVQSILNPKPLTNIFNTSTSKSESVFNIKPQTTNLFAQSVPKDTGSIFGSNATSGTIFGDSGKANQPCFGSNIQPIKSFDISKETSESLFNGLLKNQPHNVEDSQANKPFNFPAVIAAADSADIPSFSSLSKTASDSTGFGMQSEAKWQSGSKLFTVKPNNNTSDCNEENSEQNLEEEHDPHFQPIIDLPPLVAVQKDEESHDVLFRSRCKLYRYINSEWKERGVGEMKILQTKESVGQSKSVKLLMRRDQVRKICCNQRVSKTVPVFAEMPNVKSTCWVGNDFSEAEPIQEKFAVRFAHVDELNEFKRIVEKIQSEMSAVEKTD